MIVTFHEAAQAELADAIAFYNERAPGLGDSLGVEVSEVISRIVENPDAGVEVRPNVHRRLLPRFPYSVLYRPEEGRLRVLAVMHQRRDPEIWSDRV